jgi:hypothetical protein
MKFKNPTVEEKVEQNKHWTPFFSILPRETKNGYIVFMQTVQRRAILGQGKIGKFLYWEYYVKP